MSWFRRKPVVQPDPVAKVSMTTLPLGVSITDQLKIDHARYRLDAIGRYVEQTAQVAEHKLAEFVSEARVHVANLMHAKGMTEDEARAALKRIRAEFL